MTLQAIQVLGMESTNCKLQNIDTIHQPNWMNSDQTFRYIAIPNIYQ